MGNGGERATAGETKAENLVLLSRFHHRKVHEEGWSVMLSSVGSRRWLEIPWNGETRVLDALERRQGG